MCINSDVQLGLGPWSVRFLCCQGKEGWDLGQCIVYIFSILLSIGTETLFITKNKAKTNFRKWLLRILKMGVFSTSLVIVNIRLLQKTASKESV